VTTAREQDAIERIENAVTQVFTGPPMAWFELQGQRYTYETIVYRAENVNEATDGLVHCVIRKAWTAAHGSQEQGEDSERFPVSLVWRMPHKIEVRQGELDRWYARTRVAFVR